MSRGGHNWKGSGTVEGTRALDVMKLARAGYLTDSRLGSWQWSYRDSSTASVSVTGGREAIRLDYRIRTARRGLAVGQPTYTDPLDAVPLRWRATMVCLRCSRQRRLLRPPGCQALRGRPALRLPALLPSRLRGAARRTDGPRPPSTLGACTANYEPTTMARTCRHHRSRSGCGGRRTRGSPRRSRPARSGWMWYSQLEHSGLLGRIEKPQQRRRNRRWTQCVRRLR